MGSDTFEATDIEVQSERETRERERNQRAANVYRELVANGMSPNRANALVHSVFFTDDPKPVTETFVEHTGVFGLWNHRSGDWKERHDDSIAFGPRCVMQAEQRLMHPTVASDYMVVEFAPDGTPILEDVAPVMTPHETMPQGNPLDIAGPIAHYGCYACGSTGHTIHDCPERQPR